MRVSRLTKFIRIMTAGCTVYVVAIVFKWNAVAFSPLLAGMLTATVGVSLLGFGFEYYRFNRMKPYRFARLPIPDRMRDAIIRKCDQQCQYCAYYGSEERGPDGEAWHVEHVIPVSRGGPTHMGNLTLSCATCNMDKGTRTAGEYVRILNSERLRRAS